MHRGLVVQLDGLPAPSRVLGADQVIHRPALAQVAGLTGIPIGAHGHFHASAAVDVAGGDAHVVVCRQVGRHHEPSPVAVAIPYDLPLVGQQDVRLIVAIHVTNRHAIADRYRAVDGLGLELGQRRFRGPGVIRKTNDEHRQKKGEESLHGSGLSGISSRSA